MDSAAWQVWQGLSLWLAATGPATALRESELAFPVVQMIHILGLGLLAGTIAIVDLRLLGHQLQAVPADRLLRAVLPISWAGFALMAGSGLALFAAQAEKMHANPWMQLKLLLLLAAGLNMAWFHWRHASALARGGRPTGGVRRSAALSLMLWATLIVVARLIAYVY